MAFRNNNCDAYASEIKKSIKWGNVWEKNAQKVWYHGAKIPICAGNQYRIQCSFGFTDHRYQRWSPCLTKKHLLLLAITIPLIIPVAHLTQNSFVFLIIELRFENLLTADINFHLLHYVSGSGLHKMPETSNLSFYHIFKYSRESPYSLRGIFYF